MADNIDKLAPYTHVDSFRNAMTGMNTEEDPSKHTHPTIGRVLDREDIMEIYLWGWIARRLVDKPARDATKNGWTVTLDGEPFATEHFERLDVRGKMQDGLKKARLSGGCGLLLAIDDGRELDQPVDPNQIRGIDAIHPRAAWELEPVKYDWDFHSERYEKPVMYKYNSRGRSALFDHKGNRISPGDKIHADRVARIEGLSTHRSDMLEDTADDWGQSVIEAAYKGLVSLATGANSISSTLHQFKFGVLKLGRLHHLLIEREDGEEKLNDRLNNMTTQQSHLNAMVLDASEDEEYEQRTTDFSSVGDGFSVIQQMFSADIGWAISVIFGQSPQGLSANDQTGRDNYYDKVEGSQTEQLVDPITKITRYFAAAEGKFDVKRSAIGVNFNDVQQQNASEKAKTEKNESQAGATWVKSGVLTRSEARKKYHPEIVEESATDADDSDWIDISNGNLPEAQEGIPNVPNDANHEDVKELLEDKRQFVPQEPHTDDHQPNHLKEIDRTPPREAQRAARKALNWREEHPVNFPAVSQHALGISQAVANGKALSERSIMRLAQFSAHQSRSEPADVYRNSPWRDRGHVAWLMRGGDAAIEWAKEKSQKIQQIRDGKELERTLSAEQMQEEQPENAQGEPGELREDADISKTEHTSVEDVVEGMRDVLDCLQSTYSAAKKIDAQRLDVYSGPDDDQLPPEVQRLPKGDREQWVAVFNEVFRDNRNKPKDEREKLAIKQAWGALEPDEE